VKHHDRKLFGANLFTSVTGSSFKLGLTFSAPLNKEEGMNDLDILTIARQKLSDANSNLQIPTCDPLNVSPWIAMSLLQKAIRRGEATARLP